MTEHKLKAGVGYGVCATCSTNRNIFEDLEGRPIAVLFVYNSQSSVMDQSRGAGGARYITADLAGASAAFVESQFAMYCTGAEATAAPPSSPGAPCWARTAGPGPWTSTKRAFCWWSCWGSVCASI